MEGASQVLHDQVDAGRTPAVPYRFVSPDSVIFRHDPAHVVLLSGIAQRAAQEGTAFLVHMAPVDGDIAAADAGVFIERIVAPNPDLEPYLTHLGGNGGYRDSARRAVGELTPYLQGAEDAGHRRGYLEMSGALLARRTDGVPASRRSGARWLAADLRALGIERVLFGSDYPVFAAGEYAAFLRDRLPLSPDELAQITTNRSPRFLPEPVERRGHDPDTGSRGDEP